jgi:GNAT superfamily N-acetyltransferase
MRSGMGSAPLTACASVHCSSVDAFFIRPAVLSERRELEGLQFRASISNAGDRDAILAHPDAIELPVQQIAGGRVFVSEQKGVIVGFAAVEPRADGESELDGLFVDPSMQRHGIGRALVAHCAEFARAQGSGALHVVGNLHAEDFYIACGFTVMGTTETRFGTALLMRMMI